MLIDCISDLHGFQPSLPGGDLLIIAGDLTAKETKKEYEEFFDWMYIQKYSKKVLIAGNHDTYPWESSDIFNMKCMAYGIDYLCDSGTIYYEKLEFERDEDRYDKDEGKNFYRLNIWGSPWSLWFDGINPHCTAFTGTEKDLEEKFKLIPDDVDILVTHSPPYGILDKLKTGENVGSKSLALKLAKMQNPPKLWVWGHIHESYGIDPAIRGKPCKMVNASIVNEKYEHVNKSVRIEL